MRPLAAIIIFAGGIIAASGQVPLSTSFGYLSNDKSC
jgi:hypothetical protein